MNPEKGDCVIRRVPIAMNLVRRDMGSTLQHVMLSIVPSKRSFRYGPC